MSTTSKATATPTATSLPAGTTTASYVLPGTASATGTPVFYLPTGTSPFTNLPTTPGATGSSGSSPKSNLSMIVGATVGGVVVLAMLGLLVQRYRARPRSKATGSHQSRNQSRNNQNAAAGSGIEEDRGDRAKLAKSFTIRRPPSVYVEDDMDLDMTGHPRYKSASDAVSHPYYGDRSPGVVEYELTDTNGQKYGPGSVAERKRYVEQQQRKVMDEYEMFNPHMDAPPTSPYPPSHATAAPSYTSGPLSPTTRPLSPMSPSMGGRSPRVNYPSQSPSPYGRTIHQQQDEYTY